MGLWKCKCELPYVIFPNNIRYVVKWGCSTQNERGLSAYWTIERYAFDRVRKRNERNNAELFMYEKSILVRVYSGVVRRVAIKSLKKFRTKELDVENDMDFNNHKNVMSNWFGGCDATLLGPIHQFDVFFYWRSHFCWHFQRALDADNIDFEPNCSGFALKFDTPT